MIPGYIVVLLVGLTSQVEWEYAWKWGVASAQPVPQPTVEVVEEQPTVQQFTTRQVQKTRTVWKNKYCNGRVCGRIPVKETYYVTEQVPIPTVAKAAPVFNQESTQEVDQYASPPDVIDRVLTDLAIQPNEVFLDVGSGDGRAVVAAAKKFGCRAIGIEQDPQRIAIAQANAAQAGVSHLVSFIQGDFNTVEWPRADVGYAYLFPEDLSGIRNKLMSLDRFVTFAHKVPNLEMYNLKGGDTYLWDSDRVFAWWNGRAYTAPPCSRSNCSMCNSIKASLNEQRSYRDRVY